MNWEVQVFGGVTPNADLMAKAPIDFGTPGVVVAEDGSLSDPTVPLVYSPVRLETRSPGSVSMVAEGVARSLHVMENVWHVWFGLGSIEIEGMECRDDGVLVHSRWEAKPVGNTPEQEQMLRDMFGD